MTLIRLNSLDDARLAPFRDLPKANLTAVSGRFIVEGKLLVDRLIASDYSTESLVVDENRLSLLPESLPEIPVYILPAGQLEALIGFNFHRGILACGHRQPRLGLSELNQPPASNATYVVCINVQDPTNLGGILRNCAAFGVEAVLLSRQCADPFSRRVLRVSMGAVLKLKLFQSSDLLADLRELREKFGVELIAAVLDPSAERLERASRAPRSALLIGNEAHGLGREWIEFCQRRVTLPMELGTDSLNASSATAVFLYHFTRVARGGAPVPAESSG